jgi:hypothetical protein
MGGHSPSIYYLLNSITDLTIFKRMEVELKTKPQSAPQTELVSSNEIVAI